MEDIRNWIQNIEQHASDNVNKILVGNEADMDENKRVVPTSRGQAFADEYGIKFFETVGSYQYHISSTNPLDIKQRLAKSDSKAEPQTIKISKPDPGKVMEEYDKHAWEELIDCVEQVGIDAIEVNFSCPHGMPERRMGASVGQDCVLLEKVCDWVNAKATIPVWEKMTP
ncbi:hypothetical protein IFM89_033635 [Coptis chinensis]|uniref:Dihydropyrimidine dehydrogenase (NADP(+)) n=1 Tax=Coptis chinensis TaxID=261450 RepID=A0A835LP89_9MAGN|nr:hypothetical protein IFM89_033635 [Coptis chinensis]